MSHQMAQQNNTSRDSDTIKMTHYIVQLAQNDTL